MKGILYLISALLLSGFVQCANNNDDPFQFLLNSNQVIFLPEYYVPGPESDPASITNSLELLINLSERTVYCSFLDVNVPGVVDALLAAKHRGVDVRIGLEADSKTSVGFDAMWSSFTLDGRDREMWLGNESSGSVNYLNLCVGDRTRIWFSTVPPVQERTGQEVSYSVYMQSPEDGIARKFNTEMDLVTHGSFGGDKQKLDRRNYWLVNDAPLGVYFTPAERTLSDFTIERVIDAQQSVRVFASDFQSNRTDTSDFRQTGDLAWHLNRLNVSRGITGTLNAFKQTDYSAEDENGTDFKDYWNLSTSTPGPNSLYYLYKNGREVKLTPYGKGNGLNILMIDTETRSPMALVASHPFSGQAESSHDGFFLVIEYRPWVTELSNFLARIESTAVSPPSLSGDTASVREVVISELLWMGSVNRNGEASSYEFVEIYNNSSRPVNLTDWKIECGSNGTFSDAFVFSHANEASRAFIGPGQYFVFTDDTNTSSPPNGNAYVRNPDLKIDNTGSDAIPDDADQCRLMDRAGNVIDTAGQSGVPFITRPDHLGKIDADSGAIRSMERRDFNAPGDSIESWNTNTHSRAVQNGNLHADFAGQDDISRPGTYATPGYRNSVPGTVPDYEGPARGLKINEIQYTAGTDWFIEIYNAGDQPVDLAASRVHYIRDSGCDLSNGITTAEPLTGSIAPGGYYLIARGSEAGSADLSTGASFSTSDCIAIGLGDSIAAPTDDRVIDWVSFNPSVQENSVHLTLSGGDSYSRCPSDGTDTDVNTSDFALQGSTPGSANVCVEPVGNFYSTSLESGDPVFVKESGAGDFSIGSCPGTLAARSGSQGFTNTTLTTSTTGRDIRSGCIALPNDRQVRLQYYGAADPAALINTRGEFFYYTDSSCSSAASTTGDLLGSSLSLNSASYQAFTAQAQPPADATHIRIRIRMWYTSGGSSSGDWCIDDVTLEGL